MNSLKQFWKFLKKDSWPSLLVTLLLLIIIIKYIFFPLLSLLTGSPLPLVVVESCSMYHKEFFDNWWDNNNDWYQENEIHKSMFNEFPNKNGMNKGDIILVWGYSDYDIGDIIIFVPNQGSSAPHPIIHRIVSDNPVETKGDNNPGQLVSGRSGNSQNIDETNISKNRILGKATIRIPALGWIKLFFFEFWKEIKDITGIQARSSIDNWFCS